MASKARECRNDNLKGILVTYLDFKEEATARQMADYINRRKNVYGKRHMDSRIVGAVLAKARIPKIGRVFKQLRKGRGGAMIWGLNEGV